MVNDTIIAPATAMVNSGIGIIRLSGDKSIEITSNLFSDLNEMKSHTIRYGFLVDGENVIDEVMVSLMKAPHSYTREDVVEINCHGGVRMMNHILECLIKNGARLAEPGEFTKRAFLNGRIDLTQAEAVMDIIRSKNEFALRSSVSQLRGKILDAVVGMREDILYQIAYIEAALDDPEHFSLDGYDELLHSKVEKIMASLESLLKTAGQGRILKEGINTVIVGKPNVGKSSLLNLLVGEDRAIVTDIAGTTRDILSESVLMDGFMLNIIDTAGIRQTEEKIEKIGVEKTLKHIEEAELIIYMIDLAVGIDDEDIKISELISNKKVITLLNKVDINRDINDSDLEDIVHNIYPHVDNSGDIPIIKVSAKKNIGMKELTAAIRDLFLSDELKEKREVYITSERHKEALHNALASMKQVREGLINKVSEDFLTIDMMSAYESLGKMIGEQVDDDLVNEIFGKFCVGK